MHDVIASWDDVKRKGRRIYDNGDYNILKASKYAVLADVQGDHGVYTVYINDKARVYAYSNNTIDSFDCTCTWSEWAFNRETFHGRMCSHVYAMYLYLSKKRHSMIDNPQTRQADASYARIRDYIGGTEFPDAISRAIRNPGGSDWEKILADVRADLGPVSLTTFDQALGAFKGITSSRRGEDNSLGYTNAHLKQAALSETDCLDFAVSSLSDDDFLDLVLDDPDNSGVSFDEEAIDSLVNGFIDANYDNLKPGFSRDNAVILIEDYSKELFMNRRSYRSASRKRASLGPYYKLTEDDFLEYVTSYLSEDEILAIADDDLALDRLVDQYMADERLDLSIDFDPAVAANLLFSSAEDIASDRGITASRKRAFGEEYYNDVNNLPPIDYSDPKFDVTEEDFADDVQYFVPGWMYISDYELERQYDDFLSRSADELSPSFSKERAFPLVHERAEAVRNDPNYYASRKSAAYGDFVNEYNIADLLYSYFGDETLTQTRNEHDARVLLDTFVNETDYAIDARIDMEEALFQVLKKGVNSGPGLGGHTVIDGDRPEPFRFFASRSASRKRAAEVHSEYPGGMEGFITDFYGVTGSRVLVTDKIAAAAAAAEYRTAMGLVQASQRDLVSEVRASAEIVSRGHYTSHRARRVPSKTAGRHFTAIERQQLIDEEGVARQYRAGLLDM